MSVALHANHKLITSLSSRKMTAVITLLMYMRNILRCIPASACCPIKSGLLHIRGGRVTPTSSKPTPLLYLHRNRELPKGQWACFHQRLMPPSPFSGCTLSAPRCIKHRPAFQLLRIFQDSIYASSMLGKSEGRIDLFCFFPSRSIRYRYRCDCTNPPLMFKLRRCSQK